MTTLVIVAIAAIALLLVVFASFRRRSNPVPESELLAQLQPVSMAAFRNLLDPEDEEFLRHRLAASDFKRYTSERDRLCRLYLRQIAKNAAIMTEVAESARRSPDAAVATAAAQLADTASNVRLSALVLWAGYAFRFLRPRTASAYRVASGYDLLADRMGELHPNAFGFNGA